MTVTLAPYEIRRDDPAQMPYDTLPTPGEIISWLEGKDQFETLGNPFDGDKCPLHQFFDEVRDVETVVSTQWIGFVDPNTGIIHHTVDTECGFCDQIQRRWMEAELCGRLTVGRALDGVRKLAASSIDH